MILEQFRSDVNWKFLESVLQERLAILQGPQWHDLRRALQPPANLQTSHVCCDQPVVEIGCASEASQEQRLQVEASLRALMPWKKGPFRIFGCEIDAEWRSDWKWQRLLPSASRLKGLKVADIGANNGYFLLRMAAHDPEVVIGFEPYLKHLLTFDFLNHFARQDHLQLTPLGVEHIDSFPQFFDRIFCLGILYHHTDPVGILRKINHSMAKGGELFVDCQGIPGDEEVALVPRRRYANMTGTWFLPTLPALKNWLSRANFGQCEVLWAQPLHTDEQRRTDWAPISSLAEALDPQEPTRTIEGYPAPWRYYLRVRR